MKRTVAVLVAAVLACATPLHAQERVWTHPEGLYSVNYGGIGWRLGDPFAYEGRAALATFEPRTFSARHGGCVIFESPAPRAAAGADQARANTLFEHYTAEAWSAALGFDPANVRRFSSDMVGGVRVSTLVVDDIETPRLRSYYRGFFISTAAGVRYGEVSCSTSPRARDEDVNEVARFLASLQFAPLSESP